MSQRLLPPSGDDELADLLRRAAHDEAPPAARLAAVLALAGAGRTGADRAAPAAGLARAAGALGRRIVADWVGGVSAGAFAPAFGVRGAGDGRVHRLYRAEQCEIDLRLARQGEAWQLAGQLFGVEAVQEIALSGPGFEAAVRPDTTQAFAFPGLPAGSYSLTVKAGELDIVIPAIDVGVPGPA